MKAFIEQFRHFTHTADGELGPLGCMTEFKVEEFPVTETKHDWELSSFSVSFSARVKRLRLKMFKLPRKVKKRLKTQISKTMNVKAKDIRITGINDKDYGTKSESR